MLTTVRLIIDATPLQTGHRQRGVGTYTRELLRALIAVDQENLYQLVAHPWDGPRPASRSAMAAELGLDELPPNVMVHWLPRPRLGRLTAVVTHQVLLPRLLARVRADLFHSPGFVAALSVPGVPWRCPLPLVVTLHDFIPLHVPQLFNDKAINRWWLARQMRIARRADRLICVSEATRQDALRLMAAAPDRCLVVPEGVDRRVFFPASGECGAKEPPFILFVGGDFPNKNRDAVLAAFSRLCQATTLPHHLVLVGEDDAGEAELARRFPGLELARVRRLAGIAQPSLAQLYRDADLMLFPSTCEGFGLPVLEAMASGTPVITSTVSSLPEVAGDAALLVDPYDVDGIAMAAARILSDGALRARLVKAGRQRAAAFSWERMARQTLEVYRTVAG